MAWEITRNPAIRVLYISSTNNLASKQLKFIKDILTHPTYSFYWPEMIHPDEGKRTLWTQMEFSVDHPKRHEEFIRDPTVFTAGLTKTITGMHCDIAVLDDVVVKENAYTDDGRSKVQQQYSLLASIGSGQAREWVVGTRYHPKDLYNDLQERMVTQWDHNGDEAGAEPLYEVFERAVENIGDGTGEFLWPRQQRYDGAWFGFDRSILARKKAQYIDRIQFRSQYYNNPNSTEDSTISSAYFQYYDKKHLTRNNGKWFLGSKKLNVFASVDFAYSMSKRADYTAIVVLGVDSNINYYILEIDRFKTDLISEYFDHILKLHQKWDFRKLRAEVTAGQSVIVNDLKHNYIRPHGLAITIDEYKPTRHLGNKEERVEAILQPRYANRQIWHYQGGHCQTLEDELVVPNPSHDDIKDALASCIDVSIAPSFLTKDNKHMHFNKSPAQTRFGGII